MLLEPAHERVPQPYFQPNNIYTLNFTGEEIETLKFLAELHQLPSDAIVEVKKGKPSQANFVVKNLNGEQVPLQRQLENLGISGNNTLERLLRLADFVKSHAQPNPKVEIYRRVQPDELPLVSIITAAWRSDYFEETAQSILSQNYLRIQWIVTDEGRKGHTKKIKETVKRVQRQSRFPVLYVRNDRPLGPINLQTGLKFAKGAYVKWLDDDDVMAENYVESLVPVLEAFPEIALATTARDPINPQGQVIEDLADLYKPILPQNFLAKGQDILRACLTGAIPIQGTFNPLGEPSCAIVRRSAIPDSPFQLRAKNGTSLLYDFVLYLKILEKYLIFYLSEISVGYRRHPTNTDNKSSLLANLAPAWFLMSLHAKEANLFQTQEEAQTAIEHGLRKLEEFTSDYGSRIPKSDKSRLSRLRRQWRAEFGRLDSYCPVPIQSADGFFL